MQTKIIGTFCIIECSPFVLCINKRPERSSLEPKKRNAAEAEAEAPLEEKGSELTRMTTLLSCGIIVNSPILLAASKFASFNFDNPSFSPNKPISVSCSLKVVAATPMASEQSSVGAVPPVPDSSIKLLFVEMGVGYDQHGYLSLSL